jgi:hypothetical protein
VVVINHLVVGCVGHRVVVVVGHQVVARIALGDRVRVDVAPCASGNYDLAHHAMPVE